MKNPQKDYLWLWVASGLILICILLVIPFTRQIIILILPLGSGWDDVVFGIAFIGLLLILSVRGVISLSTGAKVLRRIFDPTYEYFRDIDDERKRK